VGQPPGCATSQGDGNTHPVVIPAGLDPAGDPDREKHMGLPRVSGQTHLTSSHLANSSRILPTGSCRVVYCTMRLLVSVQVVSGGGVGLLRQGW
jgi:hypothetical protein